MEACWCVWLRSRADYLTQGRIKVRIAFPHAGIKAEEVVIRLHRLARPCGNPVGQRVLQGSERRIIMHDKPPETAHFVHFQQLFRDRLDRFAQGRDQGGVEDIWQVTN